jgi:methylenetetrahydrofolate dehydrogenase (NADP+)/methenyltetrahydrofolate cyclohydrolase
MPAKLLEGEPIANAIKQEVEAAIAALKSTHGLTPSLAAVQVGENAASRVYIRNQQKSFEEVGMNYKLHELPEDSTQEQVSDFIHQLNEDDSATGIILQMPLPKGIDEKALQMEIAPAKDVEGLNPASLGLIAYDNPRLVPCTAMAAIKMLDATGVEVRGKEAVVLGRSTIVGKPVALLLLQRKYSATTTVCHTGTIDGGKLEEHVGNADIVIAAIGQREFVKGEWIKEGSIVIDVGINRVRVKSKKTGKTRSKIVGDVEFDTAKERAAFITPVPGGVGPVTVSLLLQNTVSAAKWQVEG